MSGTEREQKRLALVIGIGQYTHYHALQYAPPSAEDVYDLLISPQFGVCDPQCSIKKIITPGQTLLPSELDEIITRAIDCLEPEDQFIFYFCGHGKIYRDDLLLILPDSRKEVILDCYDFRALVRKFHLSRGSKAIFIVDACHSAAMRSSLEELMDDWQPDLPNTVGFMAASGELQYAKQQPHLERTIFSHYLCEGIKNWSDSRSTYIGLPALKEYINRQIAEQHPDAEQRVQILAQEQDHAIWLALNPAYARGNFAQKFKDVERLLHKGEFTSVARACVIDIEVALRQVYHRCYARLDETVRRKVQKAIQRKGRDGIKHLT